MSNILKPFPPSLGLHPKASGGGQIEHLARISEQTDEVAGDSGATVMAIWGAGSTTNGEPIATVGLVIRGCKGYMGPLTDSHIAAFQVQCLGSSL